MRSNSFRNNDVIVRLVQGLQQKPTNNSNNNYDNHEEVVDESTIDLAARILDSQLGGGAPVEGLHNTNKNDSFPDIWRRRIQNQLQPQQQQYDEIEYLYNQLTHACSNSDNELPAKIMTVLTKCIGNAKKNTNVSSSFASYFHTTAAASSNPTGSFRSRQPQQNTKSNTSSTTTKYSLDSDTDMEYNTQRSIPTSRPPFSVKNNLTNALQYEEQQILRELLYALQGIEGERIKFYVPSDDDSDEHNVDIDGVDGIRILSPALQGTRKFYLPNDHYQPKKSLLGSGAMDALRICGEAGWLVRRLQKYVDTHLGAASAISTAGSTSAVHLDGFNPGAGGQVARALARSVAHELQIYHDCLGEWEQHLNTWSLRQWLVQIQRHPVLQRLSVLAMLTEALPSQPVNGISVGGGTLLSALHAHSLHGDSRHQSLVQSILYPTSRPWFHMLYLWTTQGLLPPSWGGDFFVTLQNGGDTIGSTTGTAAATMIRPNRRMNEGNKHLWHDKYTLDKSQIPHSGIFDHSLVKPAFVVGKGINFIRSCLNEVGWTLNLEDEEKDKRQNGESGESDHAIMERLGYHYVADPGGIHLNPRLTKTLLHAEKLVHSYILRSLRNDHDLLDHLFALKQFMFHGQGDFFSSLLEGLYSEFGCGTKASHAANTSFVTGNVVAGIYQHQLLTIVEASLRQTNAKDLPVFCLERLRVEMIPFEPDRDAGFGLLARPNRNHLGDIHENDGTQGEDNRTVWDIFMLDYTVPDPLVAIVHGQAMEQYKLVYSFLFGLRKVEYMLNRTWRQSATLQHALQMMAQNNGLQTSSSVGYAHATVLLRKIAMTRQAMTHFCLNLKSYCMLEVLEGGWKELLQRLEQARTLDEAIQAHDYYLEGICRKTLLLQGKRRSQRVGPSNGRNSGKFRQLFATILNIAADFCALQERLFDEALEAAEIVAQRRREAENRMTQGQWGFENEQDLAEEENFFGLANEGELTEVVSLSEAFHQCMQTFLEALDAKVNGRSRNTSISADLNDEDDEFELSDRDNSGFLYREGEEDDVDSLRFLVHQLDNNHHYGLLHRN